MSRESAATARGSRHSRHTGAIGRTRKIRAIIVLDIEGLALSAPIAGILELKAGAGQARGGLNRRGTCRADRSKEPKTKANCGHGSQRFLFASQGCSRQSHRTAPPLDPA